VGVCTIIILGSRIWHLTACVYSAHYSLYVVRYSSGLLLLLLLQVGFWLVHAADWSAGAGHKGERSL
jgi:hypothetical protein